MGQYIYAGFTLSCAGTARIYAHDTGGFVAQRPPSADVHFARRREEYAASTAYGQATLRSRHGSVNAISSRRYDMMTRVDLYRFVLIGYWSYGDATMTTFRLARVAPSPCRPFMVCSLVFAFSPFVVPPPEMFLISRSISWRRR